MMKQSFCCETLPALWCVLYNNRMAFVRLHCSKQQRHALVCWLSFLAAPLCASCECGA